MTAHYGERVDDTEVTFPAGDVRGTGTVQAVVPLDQAAVLSVLETGSRSADDLVAVIVDRTPFHPVDHTWPDQPCDGGVVAGVPVLSCVTAAESPEGDLLFGRQITARRGDPQWRWVVAHIVSAQAAASHGVAAGAEVPLHVDEELRAQLSRGHSACHLAALALNQAAVPFWDKDPGRSDSLGHPDLDSLAITESRIEPDGALDVYRLGKSVRRKGLRTAELLAALPQLQVEVTGILDRWTGAGGTAQIDTGGDTRLTARRTWRAYLPPGAAEIPCGGTHVAVLADVAPVAVAYQSTEDGFQVITRVGA